MELMKLEKGGWRDGWRDGWMDGRMNGWMGVSEWKGVGGMDGWTDNIGQIGPIKKRAVFRVSRPYLENCR